MSARVASKYSNLPDIDLEQPDVYETPDEAQEMELDVHADDEHPLSEDISTLHISPSEALARFRAGTGEIQGNTALARYQRSLFRSLQLESLPGGLEVSSTSSATGGGIQESKEQRLRRLIYETQELRDQIGQDNGEERTEGSVNLMRLANQLSEELVQLEASQQKTSATGAVPQTLWRRFDESIAATGTQETGKSQGAKASGAETQPLSASQLEMEQRVAALERLLGTPSGAAGRSLVESVGKLRQQMDVLADPARIDGIQRRVKQLLVDIERLDHTMAQAARSDDASKPAGARLDPAVLKRIDQVYEKLAAVDALVELAPATAARLQSLARLHADAAEAASRISRIEAGQATVGEELAVMREVADGLRAAAGENAVTLRANMEHLDARVKALGDRVQALGK
ncbi:hypothetical protein GGI07_004180 [Coemansia sp. Benny D115]|nr:hypothetical protein GGI07_004180 [Coemansia sp. Benny D115]